ncbi:MAG: 3'-5' exonuclease [Aquificota bacterium]|nr:3'-5' exonuclease [Aquificota bacterium]
MIPGLKIHCLKRRYSNREAWRRFYRDLNLNRPIEKTTFTVIDTETTGLNPKKDRLVSLGAVKVRESLAVDLSTAFHRFLRVDRLSRESVEVHGITLRDLAELGEDPEKVMEDFMEYAVGTVVVGFNVEFDIRFVERYLRRIYGIPFPFYRVDVLALLRRRGVRAGSLEAVARAMGACLLWASTSADDAYTTALLSRNWSHHCGENL